jgi:NADH:ubiquinone oxidoreductase subunit 5 (subunit L)/multisubunit Na+/H+ antiporter MnhA subunit
MMIRVLWPLAGLSVIAGFLNLPANWFGTEWLVHYLSAVPGAGMALQASHRVENAMQLGSALITILMICVAWLWYGDRTRSSEDKWELMLKPIEPLLLNGFYLDRIYQDWIVTPYRNTADFLWQRVDTEWVDGRLDGMARSFPVLAERLRAWTTGRVSQYVTMMIAGFALILCSLTLAWWVLPL